jgi:FkbM family methyltransferase
MEIQTADAKGSEIHGKARVLFQNGDYEQAAQLLAKSMLEGQTSERWNDWASAKFLAGQAVDAEGGYRRALELAPDNAAAVSNLGALLAGQGRYFEAVPLLEFAIGRGEGNGNNKLGQLLDVCKAGMARAAEGQAGDATDLWRVLTRGLALQTVSLDRVLLRVINLETDIHNHLSAFGAPRSDQSILRDRGSQASAQRFVAYLGDNLALTRVLDHFKMYVDTRDISLTPHLLLEGNWEMWITKVFREFIRPGQTVVDVGANVGYYTLLGAAGVGFEGRVHAVEADPQTFEILEKNIDVNGYGSIVQAHQCAASGSRGELTLYQFRNHHGSNTVFDCQADPRVVHGVKVPAIPLDDLIAAPVDVMKIDAEGSEPLIFEGMQQLLRRSPRIQILMEFAPQMIERTIRPLEFLKRIRAAKMQCKVVTHDSTIVRWADEKLVEPGIHTVLLSHE